MPHRLVSLFSFLLLACVSLPNPTDAADIGTLLMGVRDNGQYANVDPDIKSWVESLTDNSGIGCCATADGIPLQEPDWEMDADGYRVNIDGSWHRVPERAVVNQANKLGHTVVWFYRESSYGANATDGAAADVGRGLHIRCFLPGSAT